ncbi:sugar ABC transporter substrate-binding protein [Actinomadura vinacea]|uniref:Sugar ABC transporter substrate-binding protein n=1 Tax=Actinomadura vinacea TaxID=115336 RepID=A0ABN3IE75_9ACTN
MKGAGLRGARRRTAGALAVGVLLAVAAVGCANPRGGAEGPKPEQGGTLTFASWHWLESGRGELLQAAVSKYTARRPGVTIRKQAVTRAEYEKTMSTQIGAGRGPDVFIIPDTYFPELAEADALEPLDGLLDPATEARLLPAASDFVVGGKRLALLSEQSPYGLFWNKKLLDQAGVTPPKSFDELFTAAETVHKRTGKIGFAGRHQMNEEPIWWSDHANWTYGFGGRWSDGERLTINSPQNVAAETAFKKMYDSPAFSLGDDASTYRSKFAAGQVGLIIDCATCMRTMVNDNKVVPTGSVGGSAIPFPSGGGSAYVALGLGINPHSRNKALARDFLKWLYSPEGQQALQRVNHPSTVGTDIEVPADLLATTPWVKPVYDALPKARKPVVDGFGSDTPRIRRIVLSQVERILTRDADPETALDQAQREAVEETR